MHNFKIIRKLILRKLNQRHIKLNSKPTKWRMLLTKTKLKTKRSCLETIHYLSKIIKDRKTQTNFLKILNS